MQDTATPAGLNTRESAGQPDGAIGTFEATYITPFLAHACMEVLNCTVSVTKTNGVVTGVELWVPTQGQSFIRGAVRSVSGLSGLTDAQIKVNSMFCGGGFGRKIEMDYVIQAVKIAVAMGCRASDTRNFFTMSASLAKSRFTWMVEVRYIMSRPRLPTMGM